MPISRATVPAELGLLGGLDKTGNEMLNHIEDVAVHWGMPRIVCDIAEERGGSKLISYASQVLTADTRTNGDSQVDHVNQ